MKNLLAFLLVITSLTSFSQDKMDSLLIAEINSLRSNPESYVPKIERYIKFQEKDIEMIKSGKMRVSVSSGNMTSTNKMTKVSTTSGVDVAKKNIAAAKELIEILKSTNSLPLLIPNVDMDIVTDKHGEYLDSVKSRGHYGPNGQTLGDRFKNVNVSNLSENVGSVSKFNYNRGNFEPMIVDMLVDSFNETRGHRNNLLNPDAKFISVYVSEFVCVQNFAN